MLELTYDFYKNSYGGSAVSEPQFEMLKNRVIAVSCGYLSANLYTLKESDYEEGDVYRLTTAICASMDYACDYITPGTNSAANVVTSESISGVWSKSYAVPDKSSDTLMRNGILAILIDYLNGSPFMSRGYYIG